MRILRIGANIVEDEKVIGVNDDVIGGNDGVWLTGMVDKRID